MIHEGGEKEVGALDAVAIDDGLERVQPFPGLDGVDVDSSSGLAAMVLSRMAEAGMVGRLCVGAAGPPGYR